jgi:hypothetical protein
VNEMIKDSRAGGRRQSQADAAFPKASIYALGG